MLQPVIRIQKFNMDLDLVSSFSSFSDVDLDPDSIFFKFH